MPHQRQQPGFSDHPNNAAGNPLRTLLDGLKNVSNTIVNASPPTSTQPVPQMLVMNNTVLQQRPNYQPQPVNSNTMTSHVVRTPDSNQPSQTFVLEQQPRPQLLLTSVNNGTVGPKSSLAQLLQPPPMSDKVNMNGAHPLTNYPQQSLPRQSFHSQPIGTFLPNSIQATKSAAFVQREANVPNAVFQQSVLSQQRPQVLNTTGQPPHSQEQPPVSQHLHQTPQPEILHPNPLSYPVTELLLQRQPSQIIQNAPNSSNPNLTPTAKPHPNTNGLQLCNPNRDSSDINQSSPLCVNKNQSHLPLFTTTKDQSLKHSHLRTATNDTCNSKSPSLINAPNTLSVTIGDSVGSLNTARLQEGDRINRILKDFKHMLESKSRSNGSASGLPTQLMSSSDGGSAEEGNRNSIRTIQGKTFSANNEQTLNPVVKSESEVIEVHKEDDDCLVTSVDFSKKIFVLPKDHHNAVIDLVDDDDNDDAVVHTEPIVTRSDPDATVVCADYVQTKKSLIDDAMKDYKEKDVTNDINVPIVTSSAPEKQDTAVDTVDKTKDNQASNSSLTDIQKNSNEMEVGKTLNNESHPQNSSPNIQHSRSALGNNLHSMKENESGKSKKSPEQSPHQKTDKHVKNVGNDYSNDDDDEEKDEASGEEPSLHHVVTNVISDLNLDSPSVSEPNFKSKSFKVTNKPCPSPLKRAVIDITSLCKKSSEFPPAKNPIASSDASISPRIRNNMDVDDDMIDKHSPKSKEGISVNKGVKRHKSSPKYGSNRGPKRFKNDEGASEAAGETHAEGDKESISLDQHPSSTNDAKKDCVKNPSNEEIFSFKVNGSSKRTAATKALADDTIDSNKKQEKSPKVSMSNSTSDESDNDQDDDDDDSDSSSMADSSCSSSMSDSSEDADVQYTCKLCSKSFSKRSHLKKHMSSHYKDKNKKKVEKRVMCKGCRRKFSDTTALQAHLLQRRYCFFDSTRVYWKKDSSSKVCQMCGKGQAKLKDLKKHSYRDLTCRLRFINLVLERIQKHGKDHNENASHSDLNDKEEEKRKNKGKNKWKNDTSGKKQVRSETSNQVSQDENAETSPNFCNSCKQKFESPIVFRKHLNEFDKCKQFYLSPTNNCPVKLNYCSLCSIFFCSQSKLLTHLCCGQSNKARCDVCMRVFNDKRCMMIHQKKSPCGMVISKTPVDESNSDQNVVKVTKRYSAILNAKDKVEQVNNSNCVTRPHNCDVCQKSFNQIQELLDHSHLHTDEGQYKCKDCSMIFGRYNSLVSHMIWHKRKQDLEDKVRNPVSKHKNTVPSSTKQSSNDGLEMMIKKCPQCPLRFKNKEHYYAHLLVHKAKEVKKKASKNMIGHVNRKKENIKSELDDMKFSCSKCDQRFSTLSGRNDHLIICRSPSQVENNDVEDDTVTSTSSAASGTCSKTLLHKCTLCSIVIQRKSFHRHFLVHRNAITANIKQNSNKPLHVPSRAICIICKKMYTSSKLLLRHLLLHKALDIRGPVQSSYQKPLKGFKSQTSNEIIGGKKFANEGPSQSPVTSPRGPLSPSHKKVAQKVAQKTYEFSCKICNKMFSNILTFKFHLKIAHKNVKNERWSDFVNYLNAVKGMGHDEESVTGPIFNSKHKTPNVSISPPRAIDMDMKVSCEICQKVFKQSNRARHMQNVHGLPRAMFLIKPRKSSGVDINPFPDDIFQISFQATVGVTHPYTFI